MVSRWLSGCLGLAVVGGMLLWPTDGRTDIRNTKHNLTEFGPQSDDPNAVCVYCHTPVIAAAGETAGQRPSWHAAGRDIHRFVTYDDIGRGADAEFATVGSQSVACLSCHDGTQAMSMLDSNGENHPFGVPYRGGSRGLLGNAAPEEVKGDRVYSVRARQVTADADFRSPSSAMRGERRIWWVSGRGVTPFRGKDDLPLYERVDDDLAMPLPYIECSSCHDPHIENGRFLRVVNYGSRLCLTCHSK